MLLPQQQSSFVPESPAADGSQQSQLSSRIPSWLDTIEPTLSERSLADKLSQSSSNEIAYTLACIRAEAQVSDASYSTLARLVGATASSASISPTALMESATSQARPLWIEEFVISRGLPCTQLTDHQNGQPQHDSQQLNTPAEVNENSDVPMMDLDEEHNHVDEQERGHAEDVDVVRSHSPVQEITHRKPTYSTPQRKKAGSSRMVNQQHNRRAEWTDDTASKVYEYATRLSSPAPLQPGHIASWAVNILLGDVDDNHLEQAASTTLVDDLDIEKEDTVTICKELLAFAERTSTRVHMTSFRATIDRCIYASLKRRMVAVGHAGIKGINNDATRSKRFDRAALRWLRAALALGDLAFTPLLLNIGAPFASLWKLADVKENLFGAFLEFLQTAEDRRYKDELIQLWNTNPKEALRRDAARFTIKYMIPMSMRIMIGLLEEQMINDELKNDWTGASVDWASDDDPQYASTLSGASAIHRTFRIRLNGSYGLQITTPSTALTSDSYKTLLREKMTPPAREDVKWISPRSTIGLIDRPFSEEEFHTLFLAYRAVHNLTDDTAATEFTTNATTMLKDSDLNHRWETSVTYAAEDGFAYTTGDDRLFERARRQALRFLRGTSASRSPGHDEDDGMDDHDDVGDADLDDETSEHRGQDKDVNSDDTQSDAMYFGPPSPVIQEQSNMGDQDYAAASDERQNATEDPQLSSSDASTDEIPILLAELTTSHMRLCQTGPPIDGFELIKRRDVQAFVSVDETDLHTISTSQADGMSSADYLKIKKELSDKIIQDRKRNQTLRGQTIEITINDDEESEEESEWIPGRGQIRKLVDLHITLRDIAATRASAHAWFETPMSERTTKTERLALLMTFIRNTDLRGDEVEARLEGCEDALRWYREHREIVPGADTLVLAKQGLPDSVITVCASHQDKMWLSEFYSLTEDELIQAVDWYIQCRPDQTINEEQRRMKTIAMLRLVHLTPPSANDVTDEAFLRAGWRRDYLNERPERQGVGGGRPQAVTTRPASLK